MFNKHGSVQKLSVIFVLAFLTSACSNNRVNSDANSVKSQDTYPDTFESINRKVFGFNNTLDGLLLKPAARAYKAVTPNSIDQNIGSFLSNLDDVGNVINNTLQFKFADAGSDIQRLIINSTLGFGGIADIASAMGLEKHDEDFGQTLAKWGVSSGPYVMLPLLGPSSVRDGIAKLSVDRVTDPANYSDINTELLVIETLKKRSDLFSREAVLNDLSDDKYSAIRGLWTDNRKFLINDGKIEEQSESDMIDELESLDDI